MSATRFVLAFVLAGCGAPTPARSTAAVTPSTAAVTPSTATVTPSTAAVPPSAIAAPASAAPALYGAGVFSTGAWDFFVALTPDQQRALLCRADDAFQRYDIFETRFANGAWSPPVKPKIFAQWGNADPHLTPDGTRVFFISNRPGPGETGEQATFAIWVAALGADGAWAEPARLPAPVNAPSTDAWSPAVAASGNLYFGASRPGGRGDSDLWVARWVNGAYQPPENLGDAINTPGGEVEPWIAPDESYLIFSAVRRADSLGGYDLYISHRRAGGWTPARRLPAPINARESDFNQSVSPDGQWLYFSSSRPHAGDVGPRFDQPRDDATIRGIGNGKTGDIYRVPMTAVLAEP